LKQNFDVITQQENAKKAKEAADALFPNEKWIQIENGIYLSSRRSIGKNSNYLDELRDAQILRDFGNTVYLAPEPRNDKNKKYDAIVNDMKFEFKNMHGSSVRTLKDRFIRSREQAPNVFLNLENSPLLERKIIKTLYAAMSSEDYKLKNRFKGGMIIIKLSKKIIYLHVDELNG
jgi:hypothetical protein